MKKHSEFDRFTDAMTQILKVSHSDIKRKLEEEKAAKKRKKSKKSSAFREAV